MQSRGLSVIVLMTLSTLSCFASDRTPATAVHPRSDAAAAPPVHKRPGVSVAGTEPRSDCKPPGTNMGKDIRACVDCCSSTCARELAIGEKYQWVCR